MTRTDAQVRVSFTLDDETQEKLDRLKQVKFYDKSYSEMYRWLVARGLELAMNKEA